MRKTTLAVGLAVGYVLGTRDGRGRYQQIKQRASDLWHHPAVQEKASQAQGLVKENAPKVQDSLTGAAKKAAGKAKHKATDDHGSDGSVDRDISLDVDDKQAQPSPAVLVLEEETDPYDLAASDEGTPLRPSPGASNG